jgi:hypothetical protein
MLMNAHMMSMVHISGSLIRGSLILVCGLLPFHVAMLTVFRDHISRCSEDCGSR